MAARTLSQASLDSAIRDFHEKIQRISNSRDAALISYAAAKLNDVLIECQANGVPVEEEEDYSCDYDSHLPAPAKDWNAWFDAYIDARTCRPFLTMAELRAAFDVGEDPRVCATQNDCLASECDA